MINYFSHKIILVHLLIGIASISFAQKDPIKTGDFNYEHRFYKEAVENYLAALNSDKTDPAARLYARQQLAFSYHHLFDYENAEKQYHALVNDTANEDFTIFVNYGHILRNNGNYHGALDAYLEYAERTGKVSEIDYYSMACQWAIEHQEMESDFTVSRTNIETGGRSFGVAMHNDGLIYSKAQSSDYNKHTVFYDICFAKCMDSINFSPPTKLLGSMNKAFYEGAPSLTRDGSFLYYTGNSSERVVYRERNREKKHFQLSKNGTNILKVFVAEHSDSGWVNSKELPFNNLEYSCTHPCIDENNSKLFFVSNMPGGFGGYDIYCSIKQDSSWTKPFNLGPQINSKEDEMTPFILGDSLFFSSKGNMGFGGSDIFVAVLVDSAVESVKNMGHPFNSPKDDFAFVIRKDQKSGYLSSNREGTHGYDHVYYFQKEIPEFPDTINTLTLNKVTGKPIPGVKFTVEPDIDPNIMKIKKTDEDGQLELILPKHIEYLVTFYAEGYEPIELIVPKENREDVIARFGELELIPIATKDVVLEIDEIYFDYDKATIRPESEEALRKIIEYLNIYPDVSVELSAHTDSRGSDSYNQRLSQKRAESTVAYLVKKGIGAKRLHPVGYGERKLRNRCANGVKCSDEEHMFNRRVELKIL